MRAKFAKAIGKSELEIFNSKGKNTPMIRGLYYIWRLEAEEISKTELAKLEKKNRYNVDYNIKCYEEKLSINDKLALECRKKVSDIFPLISREKSKEILREYSHTIEDEIVKQAIKRLTMK